MKIRYFPATRGAAPSQNVPAPQSAVGLAYALAQPGGLPYVDVDLTNGLSQATDLALRQNDLVPLYYVGTSAERLNAGLFRVIQDANSFRDSAQRLFLDTTLGRLFRNMEDGTWQ